ncbi:efflux transporter, RND family, MFP subunit [Desulfofarcimen acetoxidans DSM 771]|uniref:Efflux transporter, RND family, MFP subunit n=1 Tax=Desulfofarcimen acetoxidans (strain ATCC 49208 / DSM 771 / KCTC 5769 / VKM B-1644 / 5575) TaxID=485916 RepID=C8W458_DESAS|nr:efflux RND transporter periplasmic adaptor subunit [Desulfofarcimen acetoxidans]ACV61926.1 efflux transporter, RND family, MFP subunit [Desulfofarcimen acetoxidans DSM 771]
MQDTVTKSTRFYMISSFLKKKKLLVFIVLAICLVVPGYYYWTSGKKINANFLTETVSKSSIISTVSASATIEPVSSVSLSFKNSEIINKLYVKVGDHVNGGQLLAEQDGSNLTEQLNQSRASLKSAEAKLALLQNGARSEDIAQSRENVNMAQNAYDLAKSTLERNQVLKEQGALSQFDFDKAQSDFKNAESRLKQEQESLKALLAGNRPEDIATASAQVDSAKSQLQMALNDMSGTKLYSPMNGTVSVMNGAEGQRATANNNNTSGGGFISVISDQLQVRAQVNESDIGKVKNGQKVELSVNSYQDKIFNGKISSISPQAYTVSNVQIYDVIINPDQNYSELKAGMPANVNIILDRHDNVPVVPKGAVSYAISYLNKNRAALSSIRTAQDSGQMRNRLNSDNNKQSTGEKDTSKNSEAATDSGQQRATVLIYNKSGEPKIQRVVLGLSDVKNYEVIQGLKEGDIVVVGSLEQSASSNAQGNQSTNAPLAPRVGGGVRVR